MPDPKGAGLHEAFKNLSVFRSLRFGKFLSYTRNIPQTPMIFDSFGKPHIRLILFIFCTKRMKEPGIGWKSLKEAGIGWNRLEYIVIGWNKLE